MTQPNHTQELQQGWRKRSLRKDDACISQVQGDFVNPKQQTQVVPCTKALASVVVYTFITLCFQTWLGNFVSWSLHLIFSQNSSGSPMQELVCEEKCRLQTNLDQLQFCNVRQTSLVHCSSMAVTARNLSCHYALRRTLLTRLLQVRSPASLFPTDAFNWRAVAHMCRITSPSVFPSSLQSHKSKRTVH